MSKGVIELPENYQNHLRLGEIAFKEEQYADALNHFQAAYDLQNELVANSWLVKIALVLNDFSLASKIAEERLNDYLNDSERLRMYVESLVGQSKFQRARLFIETYATDTTKEQLLSMLSQAEEHRLRFESSKINQTMRKLSDWNPAPHEIQRPAPVRPFR